MNPSATPENYTTLTDVTSVPARAAYSYSASDSSRYRLSVILESHFT